MSDTTDGPGDDPDEMSDEATTLLASAYLDGDVTDAERARVEASDELLAEVESLRQVRAVLGATTEPPPISVRESQLAGALGVWDRMSEMERAGDATPNRAKGASSVITTPAASSDRSRRDRRGESTTSRWLLGAAAGFVVLAGAGLAVREVTQSDDSTDLAAESAIEEAAEEPVSEAEIVASEARDAFDGEESEELPEVPPDAAFEEDLRPTDDAADDADVALAADEAMEEPAEEEAMEAAPADDAMADDAVEASEPAGAGAGEADPFPPEIDLDRLQTIEELQDFAAIAAYAPVDAEAPEVEVEQPYPTCEEAFESFFGIDQFVGPALYDDQQVVVAIDDGVPATVIAYRPADCEVVEQTPLPTQEEFETRRAQP